MRMRFCKLGLGFLETFVKESKASCRLNAVLPQKMKGAKVFHFQGMPNTKARILLKFSAIHHLAKGNTAIKRNCALIFL